jgi:hypothetical protein
MGRRTTDGRDFARATPYTLCDRIKLYNMGYCNSSTPQINGGFSLLMRENGLFSEPAWLRPTFTVHGLESIPLGT